jgi:hypothetical protein
LPKVPESICTSHKLKPIYKLKHWTIAASAGDCNAMQCLLIAFSQGLTSRATIDATLTAYNTSCAEMRSEERDSAIRLEIASIGA